MTTFCAISDKSIADRIRRATKRVAYVSPGVGVETSKALIEAAEAGKVSLTVIIDTDEDAYRIGYGDAEALAELHKAARDIELPLRCQPGLRIGVLIADDELMIWAPTAKSVEQERVQAQPNAIVLTGAVTAAINNAIGADDSHVLPNEAEIGSSPLDHENLQATIERLHQNPPAPFALAQKTRVFSTRFQFVEFELRGAECTERRVKLASLFLNADLPDDLQDILETQIRPFQNATDQAFDIPLVVNGEKAYRHDGTSMLVAAKQGDMAKAWTGIRDRYLTQIKGFGWLIRKDQLEKFRAEVAAHEDCLKAWVNAFREQAKKDEAGLIDSIASSIKSRMEHSQRKSNAPAIDIRAEVEKGLQRMRVIEPKVRIVLKNVAWESVRDEEFTDALRRAFSEEDMKGWFEEFIAAKQASTSTDVANKPGAPS